MRQFSLCIGCFQVAFFRQHGCTTDDAQKKYSSRAAQMYREKLHSLALKAVKLHGTKVTSCLRSSYPQWDRKCTMSVLISFGESQIHVVFFYLFSSLKPLITSAERIYKTLKEEVDEISGTISCWIQSLSLIFPQRFWFKAHWNYVKWMILSKYWVVKWHPCFILEDFSSHKHSFTLQEVNIQFTLLSEWTLPSRILISLY